MAVTTRQRNQAVLSARAQRVQSLKGIIAARKAGFELQLKVLRASNTGDALAVCRRCLDDLTPLLIDSMVVSHLAGRLNAEARSPVRSTALELSTSVYESALKFHQRRLKMSKSQLEAIAEAYEADATLIMSNVSASVEKTLQQTLFKINSEGLHVRDAKRELLKSFKSVGLTPDNSFTLETIFRTQTLTAYSAGQWEHNQDPAIQEILWGYTYVAVGDDRTRPEHQALDGTTLPKDHPLWNTIYPPNGWNCRCQVIEVFDSGVAKLPPGSVRAPNGNIVEVKADKGFEFNPGRIFVPAA